jgi:hypothetical protein
MDHALDILKLGVMKLQDVVFHWSIQEYLLGQSLISLPLTPAFLHSISLFLQ